jgi:hypothetical protein
MSTDATADPYTVAGATICVLGLTILAPTFYRDLREWLAGDNE